MAHNEYKSHMIISQPIIFNNRNEAPLHVACTIEAFEPSLKELFFIRNPHWKKEMADAQKALAEFLNHHGLNDIWIYFPWSDTLVHTVPEDIYFVLRTARNRNIISEAEQTNYRNISVGIAGLSVGSAILSALVISGGPKRLKLADFDEIEISNLNRIRASLLDVGMNKTTVAARNLWEIDPFAELTLFDSGVSRKTIKDFILTNPRLDVFMDEMDSLDLKIMSRLVCREEKIPVLMATDNGDSIILDIERFDQEPKRPLFHGLIGDMDADDLKNLAYKDWLKLATKIVGPEYLTERMQDSLLEIGKSLPAVPQLGTSAAVAGSAIAYAIRRIANRQDLPSGRYTVGFEEKLIPHYNDPDAVEKRREKTNKFISNFAKK